MHLLLTDESNVKESEKAEFFTYGGLIVESTKVAELHEKISNLREKYGYLRADLLKFDTNLRPKQVSVENAKNIKQEVVQACIDTNCKFIAYVVLHQIAKKQDVDTLVKWGADHVYGKFNYYLSRMESYGIVAMDRLPKGTEFDYLAEKFVSGLSFDDEKSVDMDRIVLFSSTCVNASHLSSAMDIVLGSWRYCLNSPANEDAAKLMMQAISKLIWAEKDGENLNVYEKGLIMRPKAIAVTAYKLKYASLLENLNKLLA